MDSSGPAEDVQDYPSTQTPSRHKGEELQLQQLLLLLLLAQLLSLGDGAPATAVSLSDGARPQRLPLGMWRCR